MLCHSRGVEIDGRQKLRARGCRSSPGLLNTGKCCRKIEVLRQSTLDDRHEHGVVESRPPSVEAGRSGR